MGSNNELDEIYSLLSTININKLIDIINEKKEALNISDYHLAKLLGIPKTTFYKLIENLENGKVEDVNFFNILKICQFFRISLDDLSQLFVASLSPEKVRELNHASKANYLISNFDLKGLKDFGFIKDDFNIDHIENKILKFFNLTSLFEYNEEIGGVLFSRTKRNSHDKMREIWVRCAYLQFKKIENPNEYEKDKLLALIPKIRPYTRYEEKGFLTVIQALYNIGITVIVQKYLSKTQVRGGTFVIDNKPCIIITDYNKSYSTIWFALLHELYHALYDFEELKTWTYHLTGEAELDLFKEDMADYFAREILFPIEKLNYVKHLISSPALVNEYAEENKVHPSIIYSFYCYEQNKKGRDYYAMYSKYFGKPDKLLKSVKTNPWDKETIFDEITKIKSILKIEKV